MYKYIYSSSKTFGNTCLLLYIRRFQPLECHWSSSFETLLVFDVLHQCRHTHAHTGFATPILFSFPAPDFICFFEGTKHTELVAMASGNRLKLPRCSILFRENRCSFSLLHPETETMCLHRGADHFLLVRNDIIFPINKMVELTC